MSKSTMKKLAAVGILVCIMAVFAAVYAASRPETAAGAKRITVAVIHEDGTEKSFSYQTDAEYLGEVLEENGLIQGEQGAFGLYIQVVDGESAVYEEDGAYWAFYQDGEYAQQSVDLTPICDGDSFSLVYTYG